MTAGDKEHHKNIISRIKSALGFNSDLELAAFLGIKSQGITRAKVSGVPNNWIDKAGSAGVSRKWMLLGQWPMMIGEEMGPQGKGPLDMNDPDKNRYNELIEKTSKVITSKTIYKSALERNIDAFHHAVEQEDEMQGVKERLEIMQAKHDKDMEELKNLILGQGVQQKRDSAANA